MKKIILFILATWDCVMAFLAPIWLTVSILCITGKVSLLDSSFNENLAGVFGVLLFLLWIAAALVPIIAFFIGIRKSGRTKIIIAIVIMAALALICFAVCGWDTVGFLTSL